MAYSSKCPKCEHTSFEMAETEVKGSRYKQMFIRCSSCGTVVGVTEYYNIGAKLDILANKLNVRLD